MSRKVKEITCQHQFVFNFSPEQNIRITRSISKSLKLLGINPAAESHTSARKITRRRNTVAVKTKNLTNRTSARLRNVPSYQDLELQTAVSCKMHEIKQYPKPSLVLSKLRFDVKIICFLFMFYFSYYLVAQFVVIASISNKNN